MRLKKILEQTEIGKRAMQDHRFRITLFAAGSLCINLAYAIYNGVLGVVYSSFWFITMFVYYAILSAMRFYAVTYEFKVPRKRSESSVVHFCGVLFIFLALVISGIVSLSIIVKSESAQNEILTIAIATYTFVKATIAIMNLIKVRKHKSPLLFALRNINVADAVVSILTLEHSMMLTFGDDRSLLIKMDAATGAAAFLIIFFFGIFMILSSKRKKAIH